MTAKLLAGRGIVTIERRGRGRARVDVIIVGRSLFSIIVIIFLVSYIYSRNTGILLCTHGYFIYD